MIEWSLAAFRACESVRSIVIAVPPGHEHGLLADDLVVVDGGATRSQSVANALAAAGTELVAIHDAARPLLTAGPGRGAGRPSRGRPRGRGVIVAAPVTDTIKEAAGTSDAFDLPEKTNASLVVDRTLDRSRLWAAQTPQVFRAEALRAALEVDAEIRDAATDEAMLVEAAGGRC